MKFSAGYLIGAGTVVGLAVAFLSGVGAAAYVLAETERKKNELADAAAEKGKSTSDSFSGIRTNHITTQKGLHSCSHPMMIP